MKVRSGQIYTEKYTYILDTTVQQFWFAHGRPDGVMELVFLTVYNLSQGSITELYFLFDHRGEVTRWLYDATLETKLVTASFETLYLDKGERLGVEMDGASNGDLVEVTAQWIWHADHDIYTTR
jgi:hypothetical protein